MYNLKPALRNYAYDDTNRLLIDYKNFFKGSVNKCNQ